VQAAGADSYRAPRGKRLRRHRRRRRRYYPQLSRSRSAFITLYSGQTVSGAEAESNEKVPMNGF